MNLHTKTVFIVLVLLGLGFTMGMLTSGLLMERRVKTMVEKRLPGHFERHMIESLNLSEAQKEEVKPILGAHAIQVKESFRLHRSEHKARMDSLINNLDPFLDEEQKALLQETIKKMKNRKRMDRKRKSHSNHEKNPERREKKDKD